MPIKGASTHAPGGISSVTQKPVAGSVQYCHEFSRRPISRSRMTRMPRSKPDVAATARRRTLRIGKLMAARHDLPQFSLRRILRTGTTCVRYGRWYGYEPSRPTATSRGRNRSATRGNGLCGSVIPRYSIGASESCVAFSSLVSDRNDCTGRISRLPTMSPRGTVRMRLLNVSRMSRQSAPSICAAATTRLSDKSSCQGVRYAPSPMQHSTSGRRGCPTGTPPVSSPCSASTSSHAMLPSCDTPILSDDASARARVSRRNAWS
mmetsp:Transcript_14835/g.51696  ORF Transcript_14835/g.51696 Transcript_14835/m.51696 type:complete len:263 (-) Transcript_14835:4043-4831(-)